MAVVAVTYRGHRYPVLQDLVRRKSAPIIREVSHIGVTSFCNPLVGRYSLFFALGFKKGNKLLT